MTDVTGPNTSNDETVVGEVPAVATDTKPASILLTVARTHNPQMKPIFRASLGGVAGAGKTISVVLKEEEDKSITTESEDETLHAIEKRAIEKYGEEYKGLYDAMIVRLAGRRDAEGKLKDGRRTKPEETDGSTPASGEAKPAAKKSTKKKAPVVAKDAPEIEEVGPADDAGTVSAPADGDGTDLAGDDSP